MNRIMSAIDFRATVEKVHEEGADRVKLTFVGKWRECSLRGRRRSIADSVLLRSSLQEVVSWRRGSISNVK